MIRHREVAGEPVRLVQLPRLNDKALAAWEAFYDSDDIFGLDVESSAIEGLGTYDPDMATRLVQVGNRHEAWVLDPQSEWRELVFGLLDDPAKRFVSHNSPFDATRVWFEFGTWLGERSIDTYPMACLRYPGKTAPRGKGLKGLSDVHIDSQLSHADIQLHARFMDLFMAQKPRKTRLLPVNFEPGVSLCRKPKQKGKPRCEEASWTGSLCGLCKHHWLTRKCSTEAEEWGWSNIELDDPYYLDYAGLDAIYVRRLLDILNGEIRKRRMVRLSQREQRIQRYMHEVSFRGHRVDEEWTDAVYAETKTEFDAAEQRVFDVAGCKARSPRLKTWLASHGVRTKSLDKEHLPKLLGKFGDPEKSTARNPEAVAEVLHSLTTVSAQSNLLSNLTIILRHAREGDGFTHSTINTQQAHTGRMSATQPAMQTFAKAGEKGERLRGCYIARDGFVFVGADYDNQEVRIGAGVSKDPALLRIVRENLNQHALTAEAIFPGFTSKLDMPVEYHKAKTLDFTLQFGAYPRQVAKTLGIPESEATVLWRRWRETYAGFVRWFGEIATERYVRNRFERLIPRDQWRDFANANYYIQSTGRDILGRALDKLAEAGWRDTFWLPLHDELILEVPEDRADAACEALTEHMSTRVLGVDIPATGELVGTRWRGLG